MNKAIESLTKELNSKQSKYADQANKIKTKLAKEYAKVFDNDDNLRYAIIAIDSVNEYGYDDKGIYSWYRFRGLDDILEDAKEYLETYVSERDMSIDWDNSCLKSYQGGSLIINDDGDVYDTDSGKFVIDHEDYVDDALDHDHQIINRNELIEQYMKNNGYFPGVFTVDRHGNVDSVNTVQK